jgi:hypothetical protein
MRRLTRSLAPLAAILGLGFLAAACGQSGIGGAIASLSPSKSISVPSRPSGAPSASPNPTPSASPTLTPTATATVTERTSVTQTNTVSEPAAQPSSSPAAASGSGSSLLWLWIALGAVVLIGAIVLIMRSAGRRSAAAADWRSRVTDAYAQGATLYDAMSVAETPLARDAEDTAARWLEIERRADDLTRTLYALREAAPSEEDRARLEDTLASLQAVRSAMNAERTPGGAGERQAEVARDRLLSFEASLLRSRYDRTS